MPTHIAAVSHPHLRTTTDSNGTMNDPPSRNAALLIDMTIPRRRENHVLRAVVPALREGGGGSITALTTAAIHKYISTDALSSVPKAGVQHLCTAIAREEGPNGIRANCVAVGLIAVGLSQEIESPPGGILDQWMQQVALGRPGAPKYPSSTGSARSMHSIRSDGENRLHRYP